MKNLSAFFFVGLVALSGCGKGDSSAAPAVPQTLSQAQSVLPDSGYWMCRLDYQYRNRYGYSESNGFLIAGEGRANVKSQIAEACLRSVYSDECSAVVARKEFQCARAQNTGGLSEYPYYVMCNLPFQVKNRYGYMESANIRFSGTNQAAAMKQIFDSCQKSAYSDECSRAIFNGAASCATVE